MAALWVILHLMLVLSDGIAAGEEAKADGENRESRWSYTTQMIPDTTWDPLGCNWWDYFRCYDGRCISRYSVCNGYQDCSYGEDEYSEYCSYALTTMSPWMTTPPPTDQTTDWGWWETSTPGAKETNASCNFDSGDCGYSKESSGVQWIRHSGPTPSSSTGPDRDHTTGHGYYMYIETSSGGSGTVARLLSPTVFDYGEYCLQFAYHMYGTDIKELRVRVGSSLVWSRSYNQGTTWHMASVQVYIRNTQVVFEGVRGNGFRGDIAIDDVVLYPGTCPWTDSPDTDYTEEPTTAPSTWWWTTAWNNWWTTDYHTEYYHNFQVRLRGGDGYSYGRVEVYYNGQWGTVCDDNFGWNEANVICNELGFNQVDTYYGSAHYGPGSGPIWMTNLQCYGSESSLQYCPHLGWGSHHCTHWEDASVSCIASTTTDRPWWWTTSSTTDKPWWWTTTDKPWWWTTMDWWKTEAATAPNWWRWTTDWKWWETTTDPLTTDVETTTEAPTPGWWELTTNYWDWWQTTPVPPVPCGGYITQSSGIIESPHYPNHYFNNANCQWTIVGSPGSTMEVAVERYDTESCCDHLDIYDGRFTSSPRLARLDGAGTWRHYYSSSNEVLIHFTSDGSVVDNGFRIRYQELHGTGTDYWHTEEPTTALDSWWWTTAWNNWRTTANTDYYHNFQVRLRGGNGYSYGRVEVYYNGQWGTVCRDSFDYREARVVCRELGFSDYYNYGTHYGQGSGPIWMDNLHCSGYESSLQYCPHNGWGSHNCGHDHDDVGVQCWEPSTPEPYTGRQTDNYWTTEEPTTAPDTWWWTTAWNNWWTTGNTEPYYNFHVRLMGGDYYTYGRVEVYYNGQWGTVCDDGFGWQEARVVCRELGFSDYHNYYYSAYFGQGSGPIWMDDLDCSGYESSLQYCPHRGWGSHDCSHYEDVSVVCDANATTTAPTWPWTASYWNITGTYIGSCSSAGCGGFAGGCYCDTACVSERDCCHDYFAVCGGANDTYHPTVYPPWHTSQPDLGMTGSCDSDMMIVTFDLWVAPWLDGNLMHFADPTCKAFNNGSHLVLATKLSDCGTTRNETDDYVIYSNTVLMYSSNHSVIIRDLQLEVPVTCKLPRKSVVSAQFTADSNAVKYNLEREGQFDIALQFYDSSSFYYAYTGPVGLQLNQMAYAQVQLSTDDNLRIRVDSCVATPSRNPADAVIYSVIENNCPKDPTVMTYYTSSPKVERFGFRAFQFASGQNKVFLHCLVQVCDGSDPNSRCTQGCMRRGDREKREATPSNQLRQVSAGPIFLRMPGDDEDVDFSAEKKTYTPSDFAQTPALAVAIAAVVGLAVVVLGIAAMAFVYKHRRDKMAFRYQPVDTAETY